MAGGAHLAGYPRYASVKKTIIGSDNGLSSVPRQAIIQENDGFLSIRPWENLSVKDESKHYNLHRTIENIFVAKMYH